jgi:hypothetical protein
MADGSTLRKVDAAGGRSHVALVLLAVILGCANRDAPMPDADVRTDSAPAELPTAAKPDAYLISSSGMGAIQLSMTIGEAMRALPTATFARTSDGDGLALVEVTLSADTALILFADEDDAEAPIDSSKRITRIEAFSPAFHTVEGVRPGDLVREVEAVLGKTREIMKSEIESREFIEFERQPAFLSLRLDYTGVFPGAARTTKEYRPDAKILSIAVSSMNRR